MVLTVDNRIFWIAKYGAACLTQPSKDVDFAEVGGQLHTLVADMFRTMYAADGIGLAASQIGLNMRLAVLDPTCGKDVKEKLVIINPKVIDLGGRQRGWEGCLSLPGFKEKVTRPESVIIEAQDAEGQWQRHSATGLLARAFLHEIDHMDGKLYIDHISSLKRMMILKKIQKRYRRGEWR